MHTQDIKASPGIQNMKLLKPEGQSQKRYFLSTLIKHLSLSLDTRWRFSRLKCRLPFEIRVQRSTKFDIIAAILVFNSRSAFSWRPRSFVYALTNTPGYGCSWAIFIGNVSKPRRQRQRERHQTKGLMSGTITLHVLNNSLYISLPFSAKQQREMTKFCLFWRT